jgi:hypothetical protein
VVFGSAGLEPAAPADAGSTDVRELLNQHNRINTKAHEDSTAKVALALAVRGSRRLLSFSNSEFRYFLDSKKVPPQKQQSAKSHFNVRHRLRRIVVMRVNTLCKSEKASSASAGFC